jgi:plastocyanin domain-containing protein
METVPETYIESYQVTPKSMQGPSVLSFRFQVQRFKRVEVALEGKTAKTENGAVTIKMPEGFKL